jgi:hypothetical protein
MKWFSSAMLGLIAANNLGFGLALAEMFHLLTSSRATGAWHVQNQPHRASSTL